MEKTSKIVFTNGKDAAVFQAIKQRVHATVRELEPRRKALITFKALSFPLLYIGAYTVALVFGNRPYILPLAYSLMGVTLVIIFLNLIHEAVHGTLFRQKWINGLYVHFFDVMGANSYVWKVRHTRLHHNYPNIMGWDSDIEQSDMARVFPHGRFQSVHRYQHLYLPLLYPLFLLNWLLIRDFKDYFNKNKVVWKIVDIPRKEYIKLFLFKAVFLFYTIGLPMMVLHISLLKAAGAFVIMMLTGSLLALLVLISPHANTENGFPLPDEDNRMASSWFLHQLQSTNDVVQDNWFTRFFMGNFNYHIAHHLFPHVHHVYYPEVTKIIAEEARRHSLPYRSYPLVTTLVNHYRLLKQNRMPEDIFEETM